MTERLNVVIPDTIEGIKDILEIYQTHLTMEQLATITRRINIVNGWDVIVPEDWDDNPEKMLAKHMLIATENAEAVEEYRNHDRLEYEYELADICIRVFDSAAGLGIDLQKRIVEKLIKNAGRGFRHGGKKI